MDNNGLAGLELQYEEWLAGTPGEVELERDPTGEPIPGLSRVIVEPSDGRDLVLTLDMDIQYKAETELALAVQAAQAKGGNLVVMDVRNGEILAMASCPSYDANLFPEMPPELTRNHPVTDVFEPGSVLKVTTAAAALGEMIVTPTSVIQLPSQLHIGDAVFKDDHEMASDRLTFSDVIAYSSNLGTIKTALQLDKEDLWKYMSEMGCGRPSGIDFPGEAVGLLLDPGKWSATSAATLAIGQGVSVTSLQLALILGCVGNKGNMVTPHLMKETVDRSTEEREAFAVEEYNALNPDVAAKLSRILEQVVQHGTAALAATNLYNTAGKTGTAMKPNPRGGYLKSYIATFAGFAPSEDPRLVMVVTLDEPTPIYGGVVAAPCFSLVMEFALQHLRVAPSEVKVSTKDAVKAK
jgi:cell division protein FtsI (penicillin-binding protein 3)